MPGSGKPSFLRQLSRRSSSSNTRRCEGIISKQTIMEHLGLNLEACAGGARKRVMVIDDGSSQAKHAALWTLSHATAEGDSLILLHVLPPDAASPRRSPDGSSRYSSSSFSSSSSSFSSYRSSSLEYICRACKPEVEIQALVIQGTKLATVASQVKKLDVSLLVIGQRRLSPILSCLCGIDGGDEFVEDCINSVDCLTIGVRKQSGGLGGYLITTRWRKNFWLLA